MREYRMVLTRRDAKISYDIKTSAYLWYVIFIIIAVVGGKIVYYFRNFFDPSMSFRVIS